MTTTPPAGLGASASLLSVGEMQRRVLATLVPVAVERVALAQAAGRVLAAAVVSDRRLPGCDNSAMDGYAVRAVDCAAAGPASPVSLPVRGEARAGAAVADHVAGTAMRIMTGAPVPHGADAVVPWEDTEERGDLIAIGVQVHAGRHVRRSGEDIQPGMTVVPSGRRLRAIDLAACAAVGATHLEVRRRPRVAVVSGGDELVPPEVEPLPHQVVNSNAVLLVAAIEEAGGEAVNLGVVRDDPAAVRERLEQAAACDLIVSSAGVSVGAHDHVRTVVEEIGSVSAWRVALRPGKPLLLGEVAGTPLLGLPGNPVSSAVTFELFGRPALLALQGAAQVHRRRLTVRLAQDAVTPPQLETYLRAMMVDAGDGIPVAHLADGQGSHLLCALADADALVCIPVGTGTCPAGSILSALALGD